MRRVPAIAMIVVLAVRAGAAADDPARAAAAHPSIVQVRRIAGTFVGAAGRRRLRAVDARFTNDGNGDARARAAAWYALRVVAPVAFESVGCAAQADTLRRAELLERAAMVLDSAARSCKALDPRGTAITRVVSHASHAVEAATRSDRIVFRWAYGRALERTRDRGGAPTYREVMRLLDGPLPADLVEAQRRAEDERAVRAAQSAADTARAAREAGVAQDIVVALVEGLIRSLVSPAGAQAVLDQRRAPNRAVADDNGRN